MDRSQYLKALGVEEWKLREVRSVTAAKKQIQSTLPENLPFVYYVLNFGSLKLCFYEVDEMLLRKQIWRDLAEFAVKNKQTQTIERHEFFASDSAEQSVPLIEPARQIEKIFSESERVLFFGLAWPGICPEIADLTHMGKKKIGASDVLLLGSVEEFIKTPVQKRQVMMILGGQQ